MGSTARPWIAGVVVIALVGLAVPAAAAGFLGVNDGLDCSNPDVRGGPPLTTGPTLKGSTTADRAILRSEFPEVLGIPRTAWRFADMSGIDEPYEGIVRIGATGQGGTEYLVFVEGRGVARISVARTENGYLITGYESC